MSSYKYLLLISISAATACSSAPPKPAAVPLEQVAVVVPDTQQMPKWPAVYTQKGVTVKIESVWRGPEGQILGVNGTAKNATATDLRFCQISLGFLDQAGSKLDEAKASTKSLKSAQLWHFQAGLAHPSQASYSSITPEQIIAIPVRAQKAELASLK